MTRTSTEKGAQHLFAAVIILSTEVGPVDARLKQALNCLRRIVPETDLAPKLYDQYRDLLGRLEQMFGDGADGIDRSDASKLAKDVVKLYEKAMNRGVSIGDGKGDGAGDGRDGARDGKDGR